MPVWIVSRLGLVVRLSRLVSGRTQVRLSLPASTHLSDSSKNVINGHCLVILPCSKLMKD